MNRVDFLAAAVAAGTAPAFPGDEFAAIEQTIGGRLGVFAFGMRSGRTLAYRASDRFPLASTFKLPLVVATLSRIDRGAERPERTIRIAANQMIPNSSVYPPNGHGVTLTITELCDAAMRFSDNTAANALLRAAGGPRRVTAFVAATGVAPFRLDRDEPSLNEARPHDRRDTSTPAAMAVFVQRLSNGLLLKPASTARVMAWMRENRTGDARFRAGAPRGWTVADKTGTSVSGSNDIGLLTAPTGAAIAIAAYSTGCTASAAVQNQALARVARLAVARLA